MTLIAVTGREGIGQGTIRANIAAALGGVPES
jgi:nitrogenase subunit NifH